MSEIESHRFADLFPMMSDPTLAELASDIAANGLREPITLLAGKILDGRARYRACRLAGVEPRFETFEGAEPLRFAIERNRDRLSEDQRAMLVVAIGELSGAAEPKSRPKKRRRRRSKAAALPQRPNRRRNLRKRFDDFDRLIDRAAQCFNEIAGLSHGFDEAFGRSVSKRLSFLKIIVDEYRQLTVDRPAKTPGELIIARKARAAEWIEARCGKCIKSRERMT